MTRTGAARHPWPGDADLARDYEELVSMHEAVRAEADRYGSLFRLAPVALVVTDVNLVILEANAAASELLDADFRFLLGKPLSVYVDVKQRRSLRTLAIGATGVAGSTHLRLRRRTGIPLEADVTVRREGDELHWALRDRTTEAQAEEFAWQLNAELDRRVREQAAERAVLMEELPVGVALVHADGSIGWANSRGEALIERVPALRTCAEVTRALAGTLVRDARVPLADRSGDDVVLWVNAAPVTSETGGAVVVAADVTQRDQVERAHAEFVENAAHQLRNPIAAIASSVAALAAGAGEDAAERARFLTHIERESGRMGALVDALLTLAGLQGGEGAPVIEVVALRPLLEEIAASAEGPVPTVGVTCRRSVAVIGDRDLLVQAIGNVLENAVAHAASAVRIHATTTGDSVTIDIHDDGAGVPREVEERVFDRFFRAPDADRRGSGLGLAIALAAAEACRGTLELHRSSRRGTTFRFTLPGAVLT